MGTVEPKPQTNESQMEKRHQICGMTEPLKAFCFTLSIHVVTVLRHNMSYVTYIMVSPFMYTTDICLLLKTQRISTSIQPFFHHILEHA